MPAVSRAQLMAMRIAAAGKSSLGIPQAVGEEYVEATPKDADLPAHDNSAEHMAHCQKCYDRHAQMAKSAPSRASRNFHRKMARHYEAKLNK